MAKISGKEGLLFSGKAIVFENEQHALKSILDGTVKKGHVIVIRHEGPVGGPGMREMLSPTSAVMGKGLANPVGTFWSCVMLLEHLGEQASAKRLMRAIERVTQDTSLHTRDLGGTATTAAVTAALCRFVAEA